MEDIDFRKKNRHLKFFSSFLISSVFLLLMFLVIVFFMFSVLRVHNSNIQHNNNNDNNYLIERKNHREINNFGEEKNIYQCTGSCYCEIEDFERKSYSSSVSKIPHVMKTVIVSISSVFAYKLVKKHFHEDCETIISNDDNNNCPTHAIRSEVDDCTTTSSSSSSLSDEKEENESNFKDDDIYICRGKCLPIQYDVLWGMQENTEDLPNDYLKDGSKVANEIQKLVDKFNCGKLEFESEMMMKEEEKMYNKESKMFQQDLSDDEKKYVGMGGLPSFSGENIASFFALTKLNQFCEEKSVVVNREEENIFFCVGYIHPKLSLEGDFSEVVNPTVECKKKE